MRTDRFNEIRNKLGETLIRRVTWHGGPKEIEQQADLVVFAVLSPYLSFVPRYRTYFNPDKRELHIYWNEADRMRVIRALCS